jgi:hypothetical protein
MAIHHGAEPDTATDDELRRLVEAKGLNHFAFFFVSGEGRLLPNGHEVISGTVIDRSGLVYSFWTGWDDERNEPMLTRWREIQRDQDWLEEEEFREALDAVGLAP